MADQYFRRFISVVLFGLVFFAPATMTAQAQLPAPLISIRVQGMAGGASRVVMLFNGTLPQYSVYGNGTPDVSILFSNSQRTPRTPNTLKGSGNLRSVTLDSVGDNLSMGLHLGGAATVRVLPGSGPTLIVEVPNAQTTAASTSKPFSSYGPPTPAPSVGGTSIEVIPLKYADVSEVVGVLVQGQSITSNDTFVPEPSSFGAGGLTGSYTGGGSTPAFTTSVQSTTEAGTQPTGAGAGLGERINDNIAIDRRLNAVILSGTPDQLAAIKEMIAKLDVPLSSVVLETQIVELTDIAAKNLGIDFTAAGGPTAVATYTMKSLNQPDVQVGLQAALFAEISKGQGRLIAKPRIVAQSGTQASILTGDALPIVTSIISPGVNAVSQQVQYINVGVSLQIEPRISGDGYVTSHVYSEVSSVTGYTQNYPTISQRQAQTIATVKDGEPFIIGGLLQAADLSNVSKVPGLGDLPLLGGLFRVRHDSSTNTNLYIIVTPHIINAPSTSGANRMLATVSELACTS
jgi:general secretion pathway protein D